MPAPFASRQLADGTIEFDLLGPWTRDAAAAFVESRADGLVLNYVRGFVADNLDFLTDLPIRRLELLTSEQYDLAPIYSLAPTLTSLTLACRPTRIDLTRLPALRALSCDWTNVATSISAIDGLRNVYLGGYKPRDLAPISHLGHLESLRLKDRPRLETLEGIGALHDLRELEVAGSPLSDLAPAASLTSLRDLRVPHCAGVDHVDPLHGMTTMRRLDISECGSIRSLAPLRGMTELEVVAAHGNTRIEDGDLSPLLELPELRELRMMDRRSYSPGVAQIVERLLSPPS